MSKLIVDVKKARDGRTILKAKVTSRDGIQLTTEKCPHCGRPHFHGSGGNSQGFQHRLAHCVKGAPADGYYVLWGSAAIPEVLR